MNYNLMDKLISLASPFKRFVSKDNNKRLDDIIAVTNYLKEKSPEKFYISKILRDKINNEIIHVSKYLPRLFGTRRRQRRSRRRSRRRSKH